MAAKCSIACKCRPSNYASPSAPFPRLSSTKNSEQSDVFWCKRLSGGSELARMLWRTVVESSEVFEIESVDGSDAVAFGAFISTQFKSSEKGALAFNRIQLDFKDFGELRGDASLLESFDPGFVFLHELAHGVWELPHKGRGALGECEAFINYEMRGQANGGELGEMIFRGQDTEGRRRALKLMWNNRAVTSNAPALPKGAAIEAQK